MSTPRLENHLFPQATSHTYAVELSDRHPSYPLEILTPKVILSKAAGNEWRSRFERRVKTDHRSPEGSRRES
jgi:hypothetical protein